MKTRLRLGWRFGWLAIGGLLLGSAGLLGHQVTKLNATLPYGIRSELGQSALSPDGEWVVYIGDLDSQNLSELYSAPSDGSGARSKLNGPVVGHGDVLGFRISSAGDRVVYLADQDVNNRTELYSVPIDGSSAPVKLNGALVPGGNVIDRYEISPDGAWVAYLADQETDGVLELFAVPIDRSLPPGRASAPLVAGGNVIEFRFSPDSVHLVYRADQLVNETFELFSVSALHLPRRLNAALPAGGTTGEWLISADSTRVVYRAKQNSSQVAELYSVQIDAFAPSVRLNAPFVAGQVITSFQVSPDSTRVAFVANQDALSAQELFSVPIDGGLSSKLNPALVPGGNVSAHFEISSDGTRVVYTADHAVDGVLKLHSAPIDGGAGSIVLDPGLSGTLFDEIVISPDGARVVYRADYGARADLHSVPIDGSQPPEPLDDPLPPFGEVPPGAFVVEPSSSHVLYRLRLEESGQERLFRAPLDGSLPAVQLNQPRSLLAHVEELQLSDDGSRVLYSEQARVDNVVTELFVTAPDGSSPAVRVSDHAEDSHGAIGGFDFTRDERTAIFVAGQDYAGYWQLYSVPTDGHRPPTALSLESVSAYALSPSSSLVAFSSYGGVYAVPTDGSRFAWLLGRTAPLLNQVLDLLVSPDETHLLYWLYYWSGSEDEGLYSVPLDASHPPRLIDAGFPQFFQITPDSSRVIYSIGQPYSQLRSMRIDGAGSPIVLSGPGNVGGFLLMPDGVRAVYMHSQTLHGVPVDGSTPAVRLDTSSVDWFRVPQIGSRVVYKQKVDRKLFSVPADASAAPVELSPGIPSPGNLHDAVISADGQHVVYLADQEVLGRVELFCVPIDGSQPPVRLNADLIPAGDVLKFYIAPDSSRVAYVADQDVDEQRGLYSVPLQGGAVVQLGSLVEYDPDFTKDSRYVVFEANPSGQGFELFQVRSDGSRPAVSISGPLAPGGTVHSFKTGSRAVLFLAEKEEDGLLELFSARPAPPQLLPASAPTRSVLFPR